MNDVKLSGRLTRDPELKQTPNGVPVATFALAVDRKFNREEADFIPVTTWRKTAEFVAKYFRKGQRVIIASGRIRVDPYTDKDGNKRTHFGSGGRRSRVRGIPPRRRGSAGREPGRRLHGERELRRD